MRYVLRRLAGIVPILLLTWTLVFAVLELIPGDPVNLMLAGRPASEEVRENERHRLGLDRPVLERYVFFLWRAAKGDLGESYRTRQPVTAMIAAGINTAIVFAKSAIFFSRIASINFTKP